MEEVDAATLSYEPRENAHLGVGGTSVPRHGRPPMPRDLLLERDASRAAGDRLALAVLHQLEHRADAALAAALIAYQVD